jgi:hypothetical protein
VVGPNLVATLTLSLLDITPSGSMTSGLKEIKSTFSTENPNYKIGPNPAITTFLFAPSFEIKIFPNPLSGENVTFQITMPVGSLVQVDLFSPNGQLIGRLFDDYIPGGISRTITYPNNLPQGIYPYQIRTEKQIVNGRIIILRQY